MSAKTLGPAIDAAVQDKTMQQSPRAKPLALADIVANLLSTRGLALSVSKPSDSKQYVAFLTTTFDRRKVAVGVADSPSEAVIAVVGEFFGRQK